MMLQVAEAEEKTAGGLLLTEATKDKPSIGTVSFSILLLFETTVYLKSNTTLLKEGNVISDEGKATGIARM